MIINGTLVKNPIVFLLNIPPLQRLPSLQIHLRPFAQHFMKILWVQAIDSHLLSLVVICSYFLICCLFRGVPFSKFTSAILPTTSFKNFGCIPNPGLMLLTFSSVITSPAFMSSTT